MWVFPPPKNWKYKNYIFATFFKERGWRLRKILYMSQIFMNFGLQTPKNSTLSNFYILLHCQFLHTEIRWRNSTELCDMLGTNRFENVRPKFGVRSPYKLGDQNSLVLHTVFWKLCHLIVKIFCKERDMDNRKTALKLRKVPYIIQIFHVLLSLHKQLKRTCILPTHCKFCILLHCQPTQTQVT